MIARLAGIATVLALCVIPVTAKATVIRAVANTVVGRHLSDAMGVSLYLFEQDRHPGDQRGSSNSHCIGDCLILFRPVAGEPAPTAGPGVDARLIGAVRRPDGNLQATYNGWPLYYFGEDILAGDTNGHQFNEFGGDWYLIAPTGREVGGRLAAGVDYQKSERCGCQDVGVPTAVVSVAAAKPAARFSDDFQPNKTDPAIAALLVDRALGVTRLASAQ
jgi:predicted lipoprotein with Yx(FWY)xxD motif